MPAPQGQLSPLKNGPAHSLASSIGNLQVKSISKGGVTLGVPEAPEKKTPTGTLITQIFKVPSIASNIEDTISTIRQVPTGQQGAILGRFAQSEVAPVAASLVGQPSAFDPAQSAQSQVRAVAQQFGRYMEGGVLRKEDEIKYRKMFPSLNETRPVQEFKAKILNRILIQQYNSDLNALTQAGFNTGNAKPVPVPALPKLPGINKRQGAEILSVAKDIESTAGVGAYKTPDGRTIRARNKMEAQELRALGAERILLGP